MKRETSFPLQDPNTRSSEVLNVWRLWFRESNNVSGNIICTLFYLFEERLPWFFFFCVYFEARSWFLRLQIHNNLSSERFVKANNFHFYCQRRFPTKNHKTYFPTAYYVDFQSDVSVSTNVIVCLFHIFQTTYHCTNPVQVQFVTYSLRTSLNFLIRTGSFTNHIPCRVSGCVHNLSSSKLIWDICL